MEIQRRAGRLEQSEDNFVGEVEFEQGLAGCLGLERRRGVPEPEKGGMEAGRSEAVKMEIPTLFQYSYIPLSPKDHPACVILTSSVCVCVYVCCVHISGGSHGVTHPNANSIKTDFS